MRLGRDVADARRAGRRRTRLRNGALVVDPVEVRRSRCTASRTRRTSWRGGSSGRSGSSCTSAGPCSRPCTGSSPWPPSAVPNCVDELAVLEVAAARAVVVDRLAEDELRAALGRRARRRQLAEQQDVDDHRDDPLGVDRAGRQVDDRRADALLGQERRSTPIAAGGVRAGLRPSRRRPRTSRPR